MAKYESIPIPLMLSERRDDPLINELVGIIEKLNGYVRAQEQEKEELYAEIKRLKGLNQRPKLKPSALEKKKKDKSNTRAGSKKKQKTQALIIHDEKKITLTEIPKEAVFKGYKTFVVQELIIKTKNTKYLLERWRLPTGKYITAKLPEHISNNHFGANLRSYALHQYYHQGVTQNLLLEQLHEWGIDISKGGLNDILTSNKKDYHIETEELLEAGLKCSSYIQADDTGARHKGKNFICTVITNPWFAYFRTSKRKNRVNFLEILSGGKAFYNVNTAAIKYLEKKGLAKITIDTLQTGPAKFADYLAWDDYLNHFKIPITERERTLLTEGVIYGGVVKRGLMKCTPIVSDEAGQFNVFERGLCWFHAERKIEKLIPANEQEIEDINIIKQDFWQLYDLLKDFKMNPIKMLEIQINNLFDIMCSRTVFTGLKKVLNAFAKSRKQLLLVLKYPFIPLHNNLSESDIREQVKKRKISGSTRSEEGRMCRDTFASLKKTCKKLGITFWQYLLDREHNLNKVQKLAEILKNKLSVSPVGNYALQAA